uniref:Uncharacterized protein n=1 Tax=Mucochytrium quahogii TaxID=96639 RepID=A0A7S2REG7_9STRA|mmetsp:Transcript_43202/g.69270  ORF Transcript_43202/g.69270 Transcript_43202/m.69270 type:complete len:618 (+) Transcript_43202:1001-2854(+)
MHMGTFTCSHHALPARFKDAAADSCIDSVLCNQDDAQQHTQIFEPWDRLCVSRAAGDDAVVAGVVNPLNRFVLGIYLIEIKSANEREQTFQAVHVSCLGEVEFSHGIVSCHWEVPLLSMLIVSCEGSVFRVSVPSHKPDSTEVQVVEKETICHVKGLTMLVTSPNTIGKVIYGAGILEAPCALGDQQSQRIVQLWRSQPTCLFMISHVLYMGYLDGVVAFFNVKDETSGVLLDIGNEPIVNIFNPHGEDIIWVVSRFGSVRVFDMNTKESLKGSINGPVDSCDYSPISKQLYHCASGNLYISDWSDLTRSRETYPNFQRKLNLAGVSVGVSVAARDCGDVLCISTRQNMLTCAQMRPDVSGPIEQSTKQEQNRLLEAHLGLQELSLLSEEEKAIRSKTLELDKKLEGLSVLSQLLSKNCCKSTVKPLMRTVGSMLQPRDVVPGMNPYADESGGRAHLGITLHGVKFPLSWCLSVRLLHSAPHYPEIPPPSKTITFPLSKMYRKASDQSVLYYELPIELISKFRFHVRLTLHANVSSVVSKILHQAYFDPLVDFKETPPTELESQHLWKPCSPGLDNASTLTRIALALETKSHVLPRDLPKNWSGKFPFLASQNGAEE